MSEQEYIDATEHVLRPDPSDDESEKPTPNGQRWSPSHFDRPQQPNDNELSAASRDVNADHLESNTFFSTKNDIAKRFCGISYDMDGTQEVQSAAAAAAATTTSSSEIWWIGSCESLSRSRARRVTARSIHCTSNAWRKSIITVIHQWRTD